MPLSLSLCLWISVVSWKSDNWKLPAPDLEVSALRTFESHRMPGARGRETCAPSGEFGGGVVHDLDGDFAMLIDELSTKTLVFCCILKGIIQPRYLYTKPKDPES